MVKGDCPHAVLLLDAHFGAPGNENNMVIVTSLFMGIHQVVLLLCCPS